MRKKRKNQNPIISLPLKKLSLFRSFYGWSMIVILLIVGLLVSF